MPVVTRALLMCRLELLGVTTLIFRSVTETLEAEGQEMQSNTKKKQKVIREINTALMHYKFPPAMHIHPLISSSLCLSPVEPLGADRCVYCCIFNIHIPALDTCWHLQDQRGFG